jgi:esterase/lipase
MSIESALGGLALATDGSSWPSRAKDWIRRMRETDFGASGQLTTSDVEVLRESMGEMAAAIMEAHVSLMCVFMACVPFREDLSDELRESILEFKQGAGSDTPTDLSDLELRFERVDAVHRTVNEVYRSIVERSPSLNQLELSRSVIENVRAI